MSVPLASLYYETTPDYDERTRVTGASAFWNRVGELSQMAVFPIASSAALLAVFDTVMSGFRALTWVVAILLIAVPGIISAIVGKERFAKVVEKQDRVRFGVSMKEAFSNKAFMMLVGIVVLSILTGYLASVMDYYILAYYVYGGDLVLGSEWKFVLTVGYAAVGFLSIPLLNYISKRIGKDRTLFAVLLLYMCGAIVRWWPIHCLSETHIGIMVSRGFSGMPIP